MLKFLHALSFLLGTAVIANAHRVEEAPAVNEQQFHPGLATHTLRVEISHTMNLSDPESRCILYSRLPTEDVSIAYRDDIIDHCIGRHASISFYTMSDQAGQISRFLAVGQDLNSRLVGSWRQLPSSSGHDPNLEVMIVIISQGSLSLRFYPEEKRTIGHRFITDYHAIPENEDSFWYRASTVEPSNTDVMKLRPDGDKTFYRLVGEPGEMKVETEVTNHNERSLGIWRRMPQRTLITIYRRDMLISRKDDKNGYRLQVQREKVKMDGWDPAHPL